MKSYDLKLLVLFAVLAAGILFRISMEESGYLSPDSRYYLEIAQNLATGQGFTMTDPRAPDRALAGQIPVALWPIGYPGLIALASGLTGLSVFWASKLLNLVLLGCCFLLLRVIAREKAWLPGLLFCSYTLLEVFTYTWSEVPFLTALLLFAVALHRVCQPAIKVNLLWWVALLAGSMGLFLFRYIGLFSVPVLGLFGLAFFRKNLPRKGMALMLVAFLSGCLVLAYFYRNYLLEGNLSGDSREFHKQETLLHFLMIFFRGTLNELAIFRHHYFKGGSDPLFWILLLVQVIWVGWVYVRHLHKRVSLRITSALGLPAIFLWVAGAYLLFLIILRLSMPFDSFDFRLLSPVTLLGFLALLLLLFRPENSEATRAAEKHLVLFFLFSLLVNVAKLTYLKALL